jgi:hypothetical protein
VSAANSRTVSVRLTRDGAMCAIPVPFDPREVFGKARAPVRVTLGGYTYRSTIFSMHGETWIPLRKSNREAAGLEGNEKVTVKIALDTAARTVVVPPDLARALKADPKARERWKELSFTHQREHVEALRDAKKPETRARRLANTLRMLTAAKPKRADRR